MTRKEDAERWTRWQAGVFESLKEEWEGGQAGRKAAQAGHDGIF